MIEFFRESKNLQLDESVQLKYFNKRHVIFSKCIGGSESKDIYMMDLGLRQTLATNVPELYPVLNPYGYILDSNNLKNGIIRPTHSFVNTTVKNKDTQEWILQLPEGEYLCFKAAIFSEEVNLEPLIEYLQKEKRTPKLIIACEYLKSFYNPISSPYEIQILI